MDSIIIKHQSEQEFDETKLGQRLDDEMIKCLKATTTVSEITAQALVSLLEVKQLSREAIMMLTRPWYRANMLAAWSEQFGWTMEKEKIKDFIKAIRKFKTLLKNWSQNSLVFLLFTTSSEPDIDRFSFYLDELQVFFEQFIEMDFKNGSEYSAKYFRRYAIDSLFWMGKKMKLKETGSPTQLNHYINIVTDRLYADINKDYMKFKEKNFMENFNLKKNTPMLFIFNPECTITNGFLSKISARFLMG